MYVFQAKHISTGKITQVLLIVKSQNGLSKLPLNHVDNKIELWKELHIVNLVLPPMYSAFSTTQLGKHDITILYKNILCQMQAYT